MTDDRHSHNYKPITHEDFRCRKALQRMKERVKDELHTPPSEIYTQEVNRIVDLGQVPRALFGLYIKSYSHYKSCFMKIRKGLKPSIPHDLDDLNFDGDNVK